MPTRIKQSVLPHTQRRRATLSAPNAVPHAGTPSTIVPQLVPLLDLIADLIVREIWKQRSGANTCLEREVSEAHAVAAAQGASTVVEKHEKLRSVSQFPSKVPLRVPPKSH